MNLHGQQSRNDSFGFFRRWRKFLRRYSREILWLWTIWNWTQRYQGHLRFSSIHTHVTVVLGLMPCRKKNQLFLPFFNHILNIIRSETSHEPFILILLTSRRFNNIVTRLRIFSHLWELGDLRFHKTYIIWEDIKKYFKRSISVITFSG